MTRTKAILLGLVAILLGSLLVGCDDADVASRNLSKDADNFKIARRVVFSMESQTPTFSQSRAYVRFMMKTSS